MLVEFKSFFGNTFNFDGYATRSEFFSILVWSFLIGATSALDLVIPEFEYVIVTVMVVWFLPSISLILRRFHSVGIKQWIAVLLIVLPNVIISLPVSELWQELVGAVCLVLIIVIGLFKTAR